MLQLIFALSIPFTNGQGCTCGPYHQQAAARIWRGKNADQSSFPWQILIEVWYAVEGGVNYKSFGGVLISKRHVVTCAYCLDALFVERLDQNRL